MSLDTKWSDAFDTLRSKWVEIPVGGVRIRSDELSGWTSEDLNRLWEDARRTVAEADFARRGWHHTRYSDIFRGKRVLDVGSGIGIDGITFAEAGAEVTFVDIVESNLTLVQRLCRHRNLSHVDFLYMKDLDSLDSLRNDYDVIWCDGSMINAPFEVARQEARELLKHLKPNGRWVELAFPKGRWEREGRLAFEQWGEKTDGVAPWMEWYDLEKIIDRLAPHRFDVVLSFEYHNGDFIWFDLLRRPHSQ